MIVQLISAVRRINVDSALDKNGNLSYEMLARLAIRYFQEIKNKDEMSVTSCGMKWSSSLRKWDVEMSYIDEDGDLVCLSSDDEFVDAVRHGLERDDLARPPSLIVLRCRANVKERKKTTKLHNYFIEYKNKAYPYTKSNTPHVDSSALGDATDADCHGLPVEVQLRPKSSDIFPSNIGFKERKAKGTRDPSVDTELSTDGKLVDATSQAVNVIEDLHRRISVQGQKHGSAEIAELPEIVAASSSRHSVKERRPRPAEIVESFEIVSASSVVSNSVDATSQPLPGAYTPCPHNPTVLTERKLKQITSVPYIADSPSDGKNVDDTSTSQRVSIVDLSQPLAVVILPSKEVIETKLKEAKAEPVAVISADSVSSSLLSTSKLNTIESSWSIADHANEIVQVNCAVASDIAEASKANSKESHNAREAVTISKVVDVIGMAIGCGLLVGLGLL